MRLTRAEARRKFAAAMRRQKIHFVLAPPLPGSPDFLSGETAIFLEPCSSHSCNGRSRTKTREDKSSRRKLRRLGYRTMTVWECKLLGSPYSQANRVWRRNLGI